MIVEEGVTAPGTDHDQVGFIIVAVCDPLKHGGFARGRFGREDVGDPPRGVEMFHRSELKGGAEAKSKRPTFCFDRDSPVPVAWSELVHEPLMRLRRCGGSW